LTLTSSFPQDAVFEVVGTPYSLLSATLSASQPLHTRRGSLVGLSGDPSTTVSTLSLLSPLRRALVGIPFLYQRLTSTTPITALISPKSTCTSLAVLHLTGTTDWKISQRKALLAWTGNTLNITPFLNRRLTLSHWGSSTCTGRGLLALCGRGNLFSITLSVNETYIAHPANILAYSISTPHPPQPYRFKSSPTTTSTGAINLQIPHSSYTFTNYFPRSRLLTNLQKSDTWQLLTHLTHTLRTWSRRTIWSDRLFLQFTGPTTILLQSRASRPSDVLTNRDVNEIADAPPGAVAEAVQRTMRVHEEGVNSEPGGEGGGQSAAAAAAVAIPPPRPLKLNIASVRPDGTVRIEETDGFGEWEEKEKKKR